MDYAEAYEHLRDELRLNRLQTIYVLQGAGRSGTYTFKVRRAVYPGGVENTIIGNAKTWGFGGGYDEQYTVTREGKTFEIKETP